MTSTKEAKVNEVNIEEAHEAEHVHVHGPNCNHHHHHEVLRPLVRETPKIGRNDPCSCGSQKKYKKCCGN